MLGVSLEAEENDGFVTCELDGIFQRVLRCSRLDVSTENFFKRFHVAAAHSLSAILRVAQRLEVRVLDILFCQGFTKFVLGEAGSPGRWHIANIHDSVDASIEERINEVAQCGALISDGEDLPGHCASFSRTASTVNERVGVDH
jgi:hypothetical protein